jgi:hypothetical protein
MRFRTNPSILGLADIGRSFSFGLAIASVGCGADSLSAAVEDEMGTTGQALAGYGTGQWGGPVVYWDENDYEVPVCYLENESNTGSDAGYFDEFSDAIAEVELVTGLDIDWDGPCSSVSTTALPSYVTVIFDDHNNGGGLAAPGFQKRRTGGNFPGVFQVGVTVRANRFGFEFLAVHEFLHALGFMHEQQRSDSEPSCELEDDANSVEEPGADLLTPYDDQSIMNYCRVGSSGRLTHFDRVGLGVLYPKTFTRKLHVDFAFVTAAGLLSRPQGNIYPDWVRDGALDSVIDFLGWTVSGVPGPAGPRLPLTGFSTGSHTVNGVFIDFMGRSHSIPSTTVTVSAAKHTALLSTVL